MPDDDSQEGIPPGQVVTVGEPVFVGRIPVRTELTVLPADEPNRVA